MKKYIEVNRFMEDLKFYAENIRNIRGDNQCFFTEENIIDILNHQPIIKDVCSIINKH